MAEPQLFCAEPLLLQDAGLLERTGGWIAPCGVGRKDLSALALLIGLTIVFHTVCRFALSDDGWAPGPMVALASRALPILSKVRMPPQGSPRVTTARHAGAQVFGPASASGAPPTGALWAGHWTATVQRRPLPVATAVAQRPYETGVLPEFLTTSARVKMPRVLYEIPCEPNRTEGFVLGAVQAGIKGLDTISRADDYYESEIGAALSVLFTSGVARDSLFIQAKVSPNVTRKTDVPIATQVELSITKSLERLKVKYIDSLVLDLPSAEHEDAMEAWRAMEAASQAGLVRQLGMSGVDSLEGLRKIYADAAAKPAVVQQRFCKENGFEHEMRAWCDDVGIFFQTLGTLDVSRRLLKGRRIQALANMYHVSEPVLILRFVMGLGVIPLITTSTDESLSSLLSARHVQLMTKHSETIDILMNAIDPYALLTHEKITQLFSWVSLGFAGQQPYNYVGLGVAIIFGGLWNEPLSNMVQGGDFGNISAGVLVERAMQALPAEHELVGAPIPLASRVEASLGAMGAAQWSGMFKTRPHSLLNVQSLTSVDQWVRSLSRGARQTLKRATDGNRGFTVTVRPIRGSAPAPHSSMAHFRVVVDHEVRVLADVAEDFMESLSNAIGRYQGTTRMAGEVREYRDAKTGRVIAFAHEVTKGRVIRGQWFYADATAARQYVWFHAVHDLVSRAIADDRIDVVDLGPSGSDAFEDLKERYGFEAVDDWPSVANYSGPFILASD